LPPPNSSDQSGGCWQGFSFGDANITVNDLCCNCFWWRHQGCTASVFLQTQKSVL